MTTKRASAYVAYYIIDQTSAHYYIDIGLVYLTANLVWGDKKMTFSSKK